MKATGIDQVVKKFDDHYTWYGAYRHRIQKVKTGLFSSKQVLVLQYQLHFCHWTHVAGHADFENRVEWIDVKPEWLMEDATN